MREINKYYGTEKDCAGVVTELEKICSMIEFRPYDESIDLIEKRLIDDQYSEIFNDYPNCYVLNECIIALTMFKLGCCGRDIIKKIKSDIEWFYHMISCIHIYGYVR